MTPFARVDATQLGVAALDRHRQTHSALIRQGIRTQRPEPFEQASRLREWPGWEADARQKKSNTDIGR